MILLLVGCVAQTQEAPPLRMAPPLFVDHPYPDSEREGRGLNQAYRTHCEELVSGFDCFPVAHFTALYMPRTEADLVLRFDGPGGSVERCVGEWFAQDLRFLAYGCEDNLFGLPGRFYWIDIQRDTGNGFASRAYAVFGYEYGPIISADRVERMGIDGPMLVTVGPTFRHERVLGTE